MKTLIYKDIELFYFLNGLRTDLLDYVFAFLSHHISFLIAIIIATVFLTIREFKIKFWIILALIGLSFIFADRISVLCFKEVFERLRPSHALEGVNLVKFDSWKLVFDNKGGQYGFVSSHAANAFSLATIFFLLARKHTIFSIFIFIWAVLVSYSRIYCGVHYPGDILIGALLGILIGYFIVFLYRLLARRFRFLSTNIDN